MDYSGAIDKFLSTNKNLGNEALPLNVIIEANAVDQVDGGKLDVNANGQLTYMGRALSGPATDLPLVLNAPGFWLGSLVSDGDSHPFVVSSSRFPSAMRSPFTYNKISDQIGDGAVAYLDAVTGLISDKLGPSGLLPADEIGKVLALNRAGIVCVPATSSTLNNLYRLLPDLPREPVFDAGVQKRGLTAWAAVISAFDESRKSYLARSYAAAAASADAAANNAALWDKVYGAVEIVATPAILAGLAPESDNVKHLGWPTITLGLAGIAIAIGIGYLVVTRNAAKVV